MTYQPTSDTESVDRPAFSEEALLRGATYLGTALGVFVNVADYRDSVREAISASGVYGGGADPGETDPHAEDRT